MPRDTYSALKLKIEKEITRLQKQAKALQIKRRTPIISSIIRSMREYDITPEDITAAFNKTSAKAALRQSRTTPASKRPVPVKYRHPDTGDAWTGRGKAPRWIVAAEATGQSRSDFLVNR